MRVAAVVVALGAVPVVAVAQTFQITPGVQAEHARGKLMMLPDLTLAPT